MNAQQQYGGAISGAAIGRPEPQQKMSEIAGLIGELHTTRGLLGEGLQSLTIALAPIIGHMPAGVPPANSKARGDVLSPLGQELLIVIEHLYEMKDQMEQLQVRMRL